MGAILKPVLVLAGTGRYGNPRELVGCGQVRRAQGQLVRVVELDHLVLAAFADKLVGVITQAETAQTGYARIHDPVVRAPGRGQAGGLEVKVEVPARRRHDLYREHPNTHQSADGEGVASA